MECPKEHEGLPVVCLYEEGWKQKVKEFVEEKQSFIAIGPDIALEELAEILDYLIFSKSKSKVANVQLAQLKTLSFTSLLGFNKLGSPLLKTLSLPRILLFSILDYAPLLKRFRKKPKPTSGRSSQYSFHWTTVKNKRALVCRIR